MSLLEFEIKPFIPGDIRLLYEHCSRVMAESGVGDTPIFTPTENWNKTFDEFEKQRTEGDASSLSDPKWSRYWVLFHQGKIVGGIVLYASSPLPTGSHRATFGIAIESAYRKHGYGKKMIETAITWLKNETPFDWLDLYTFEHNERAIALYRNLGFQEMGRTPDQFRVFGKSLSDLKMCLKIR